MRAGTLGLAAATALSAQLDPPGQPQSHREAHVPVSSTTAVSPQHSPEGQRHREQGQVQAAPGDRRGPTGIARPCTPEGNSGCHRPPSGPPCG